MEQGRTLKKRKNESTANNASTIPSNMYLKLHTGGHIKVEHYVKKHAGTYTKKSEPEDRQIHLYNMPHQMPQIAN